MPQPISPFLEGHETGVVWFGLTRYVKLSSQDCGDIGHVQNWVASSFELCIVLNEAFSENGF
jgi:hypothetical protein